MHYFWSSWDAPAIRLEGLDHQDYATNLNRMLTLEQDGGGAEAQEAHWQVTILQQIYCL
jgi:hypothetical protein